MTALSLKCGMMVGAFSLLLACEGGLPVLGEQTPAAQGTGETSQNGTRFVERDVEAPEVFQQTEAGLWDGRPSLGGVWVAHPDVTDPERVLIRNEANQKFVIGALFRRERDNPGPRFQVSSDAAEALGMLAGAPATVNVTALRRSEAPDPGSVAATIGSEDEMTAIEEPDQIAALSLDDPAPTPATPPVANPVPQTTVAATAPQGPGDPFIQIGIFSVKDNADTTATALRGAGMIPTVRTQSTSGKTFYRVIVGPATSVPERTALLDKVKSLGFDDAYPTSN